MNIIVESIFNDVKSVLDNLMAHPTDCMHCFCLYKLYAEIREEKIL